MTFSVFFFGGGSVSSGDWEATGEPLRKIARWVQARETLGALEPWGRHSLGPAEVRVCLWLW